ncbi:hypothetical protein MTO96_003618 [Rhipicephalus appendiculatus]
MLAVSAGLTVTGSVPTGGSLPGSRSEFNSSPKQSAELKGPASFLKGSHIFLLLALSRYNLEACTYPLVAAVVHTPSAVTYADE